MYNHTSPGRFGAWFSLAVGFGANLHICINSGSLTGPRFTQLGPWAPETSSKTESSRKPGRTNVCVYTLVLTLNIHAVWELHNCVAAALLLHRRCFAGLLRLGARPLPLHREELFAARVSHMLLSRATLGRSPALLWPPGPCINKTSRGEVPRARKAGPRGQKSP